MRGRVEKTLCLNMIVRDEAAVIDRCLASVRDLVDYWVVFDTGSADDTPERVAARLAGVPGELHRTQWVDFGHNRGEAIRAARGKADYLLLLDADMVVETAPGFGLDDLTADAYLVRYLGPLDYRQAMLVRGDLPWTFVGPTHEYLDLEARYTLERIDTLALRHLGDGAHRGRKFERDRELLGARLEADPGDTRALFYLAQSLQALARWDEAIAAYERRAEAGGWEEEAWHARYQIAVARHARGDPWPEVLAALLAAYQRRPSRLEPLYAAARRCREAGEYALGHLFSRPVCDAVYPDDVLFVERDVYRYLLAFEYSICCYWLGDDAEAIRVANGLLELPDLPPEHREAVVRNRAFSLVRRQRPATEPDRRRPRVRVVVPFFNPGRYLERCLASLLEQDCDDFAAVFVDDASTDGGGALVPVGDPRVSRLANPVRRGPAACLRQALAGGGDPDEVVVVVHGEDWLAAPDALTAVAEVYRTHECDVVYGQFQHPDGRCGHARPLPDASWLPRLGELGYVAPLLSFRAGLFRRFADRLPDPGGGEIERAVVTPLIALAGFERVVFQDRPLYVYNRLRWAAGDAD